LVARQSKAKELVGATNSQFMEKKKIDNSFPFHPKIKFSIYFFSMNWELVATIVFQNKMNWELKDNI
jgi:hypothetical protein